MTVTEPSGFRIEDGQARIWFAYDIGHQIDLDQAQNAVSFEVERERIRHRQRAPAYLQFQPSPLRIDERCGPVQVAGLETDGSVEATLFDFGAVSIGYRIRIAGRTLEELPALAAALDENPALLTDSRNRAEALVAKLGLAVRRPRVADLVEDYTVFHVSRWGGSATPTEVVESSRALVARTIRAELGELSEREVQDTLASRLAYSPRDELVVDWNGALLFDAQGDDTLAVLEFANVELLEMRFLDDRLDQALETWNESLLPRSRGLWRQHLLWGETRLKMRRIANMQIDSVLLFESVNNAIKMIGDQFLARAYRSAARRMHLEDWDASILRKLQTLESIYDKLHDEVSTRRMELLEWIIIVLFLVSIVIPFFMGGSH